MIGAQVLVGLIVAVRLYYFVKENPPVLLEKRFGSKFLYVLIYYFVNAESVIMFGSPFLSTCTGSACTHFKTMPTYYCQLWIQTWSKLQPTHSFMPFSSQFSFVRILR